MNTVRASTLTRDWLQKFGWPETLMTGHPLAIAHRGACDHAPENTLKSFRIAAEVYAEMWELDVHISADGVCVVFHDDILSRVAGLDLSISQSTWAQISAVPLPEGQHIPRLEEIIALAQENGCGLYIDIKSKAAGLLAWRMMQRANFRFACFGSFTVEWIADLRDRACEYPLSVLVPIGVDPVEYLNGVVVDIVHICWRNASPNPDELLTDELMQRLAEYQIILWDEDRIDILENLLKKPIMGICSNRPELLKPYRQDPHHPIDIVCHRGVNSLAPENTLEATRISIDQRFQFIELDVRTTSDGALAVIHDPDLERTTSGNGLVIDHTLEHIQSLDAGSWFRGRDTEHSVSVLSEFLQMARGRCGIYIEVKHADAEALLETVKAQNMLEHCFFWSPDTKILHWLRQQSPEIILIVPRRKYSSVAEAVKEYDAQIIEFNAEKDDLSEIDQCHALGVRSMIHSTSSDWDDLGTYLKCKPDLVNLDYPNRFKILASYPRVRRHFEAMQQACDHV